MKELNSENFASETGSSALALIEFMAPWCGPCKSMEPHLEAIDGKPAAVFKVDIDKNPDLALKFGIRGVPSMILMKNGEIADMKSGAQSASQLSSWIRQFA